MTTTAVISGQSIGTSTNVGNAVFSQNQVSFQSTSTAFVVSAKLTNGAGFVSPAQRVRIWYSSTSWTVTAANAPTTLNKTARFVEVTPNSAAGAVTIADSSLEPVTGAKLNMWAEAPNFPIAGTLDVNLVELP